MPNFASLGLRGLMGAGAMMGAAERGIARFGLSDAGRFLASNRGRTIAGAALGGAYGAYRGDNYSLGSIAGGAAMGAGIGRYGGAFMRAGMTPGMSIRGAGSIAAGLAKADGRMLARRVAPAIKAARASRAGRASARFIGRASVAANRGYGKMRGLGWGALNNLRGV